jgi:hypothetical protein
MDFLLPRIKIKVGKNPTIQPISPLCARSIGRHACKEKDKKGSHKRRPKKRRAIPQNKAKPEKPKQSPNTALTIEFKKHSSILREVET